MRQHAANDLMKQLTEHPRYSCLNQSRIAKRLHSNQMLDDDYGGLLLDGDTNLAGDQPLAMLAQSADTSVANRVLQDSVSQVSSPRRVTMMSTTANTVVLQHLQGSSGQGSSGVLQAPSGFQPAPKQWVQSQPMSPIGDESEKKRQSVGLTSKMPQIKDHHEFNPKEASTLLIAEESRSFLNQNAEHGMTNDRISHLLLNESRPEEILPYM